MLARNTETLESSYFSPNEHKLSGPGRAATSPWPLVGRRAAAGFSRLSGGLACLAVLVESLRCDVRSVRPGDGPTIEEESLEVLYVLQGLEHWSMEPLREVDSLLGIVVEGDVNAIAATVLCTGNNGHEGHTHPSLQRRDALQGFTGLHLLPVGLDLAAVQFRPLPYEAQRR